VNPLPPDSARWFVDAVQVHAAPLKAWLRLRFPSIADPENIVQEALTRVWRAHGNCRPDSSKALLFTTAHNLAIDELRRQNIASFEPLTESEETFVYEEAPTPADSTALNQELELLTQAIQSLPERCRQVLTLRKIYGLSQKEISAQLGIAEHTVEVQVANGMRRCADFLSRMGLP
jgi:RNA polymerase sigma factor (sigma-70 family)